MVSSKMMLKTALKVGMLLMPSALVVAVAKNAQEKYERREFRSKVIMSDASGSYSRLSDIDDCKKSGKYDSYDIERDNIHTEQLYITENQNYGWRAGVFSPHESQERNVLALEDTLECAAKSLNVKELSICVEEKDAFVVCSIMDWKKDLTKDSQRFFSPQESSSEEKIEPKKSSTCSM